MKTVSKQNSTANMITHPKRKPKSGKTRPPSSAPAVADTSRKAKKFKGKCYNCNKWGHCASECKQSNKGKSSTPKPDNKANMIYQTVSANFVAMVSKGKTSREWWLNSGATCHVCNDSTLLEDVTAVKEIVTVANGGVADVLKVGNVTLLLSSDQMEVEEQKVDFDSDEDDLLFAQINYQFEFSSSAFLLMFRIFI